MSSYKKRKSSSKNKPELSDEALVRLAIKQKGKALKEKFSNIHFLNDSIAIVNGERKDVLGIYVADKNVKGLPGKVLVKLPNGKGRYVKTEIISEVGIAKITGGMDGSVANADLFGFAGSGCCLLMDKNNKNYMLSNCHVMTDGALENPLSTTGQPQVLYDDRKIGDWIYGSMTTAGDFALIEMEDADGFIVNTTAELFNNQTREILKEDWLKLQVTVRGNKCKTKKAFVIEVIKKQVKIVYKNGLTLVIDEAILLGNKPDKSKCFPVTEPGDSGGAAYDENNKLIGIITSKSSKFSYIIPVKKFIQSLSLKII